MPTEKFNFSEEFERLLLACVMRHPEQFSGALTSIQPGYFQGILAQIAMRSIQKYVRDHARLPGWTTFRDLVCRQATRIADPEAREQQITEATEFCRRIKRVDTSDVTYVRERVYDFCRERSVYSAMVKSSEEMQKGNIDYSALPKRFQDALNVGYVDTDFGLILHDDYDSIITQTSRRTYGIRTNDPTLDGIWKTGLGPGWLIVPLAPPKRFKTTFCINLALWMCGQEAVGSPVIFHYSCEISQELTAIRALSSIAEAPLDMMYEDPLTFRKLVKKGLRDKMAGTYLIKAFPSKTVTIADIRAHALTVQNQLGLSPSMIIIDYAETVKCSDPKMSEVRQSASVYIEARAMGAEFRCPVLMPDRCNRETVSKAVPSMTSFQGSFEKAGAVDIAIGLCATDEEIARNQIRYFVFLNRHGRALQHFRGKIDPDKYTMTIDEEIPYNPDEEKPSGGGGGFRNNGSGKKEARLPLENILDDDDDA